MPGQVFTGRRTSLRAGSASHVLARSRTAPEDKVLLTGPGGDRKAGLDAFEHFRYPNEIGPGVYHIQSPPIPDVAQIEGLLAAAEERIDRRRLWVNPDCGLKTRGWERVVPELEHLVEAARRRRALVAA